MTCPVFKIIPDFQTYKWGKRGSSSLVAQLGVQSIPDLRVDERTTYAELWMGTHPTNPSRLWDDPSTTLQSHLASYPELIGRVRDKFPDEEEGSLPFLFKALSPGTALGIQAHPDKALGRVLHERDPVMYNDPNHKPEMAIALTAFKAMLGFRPVEEIVHFMQVVPELQFVPRNLVEELRRDTGKASLRALFAGFIQTPPEVVRPAVASLVKRYSDTQVVAHLSALERDVFEVILMLNEQYPLDIGVLCVFLFNIVSLDAGQAAYLGANEPHAYLSGDIIECMANSNNVIRCGLTPLHCDIPTLVDMLTYNSGPGSRMRLKPVPFGSSPDSLSYDPPIDEFTVVRLSLDGRGEHRAVEGPSVCLVTAGSGEIFWQGSKAHAEWCLTLMRGDVVFIGAGTPVQWSGTMEVYRAFVE